VYLTSPPKNVADSLCASSHTTRSQPASGACSFCCTSSSRDSFVETGDDQVGLQEPVAGAGGFELVVGEVVAHPALRPACPALGLLPRWPRPFPAQPPQPDRRHKWVERRDAEHPAAGTGVTTAGGCAITGTASITPWSLAGSVEALVGLPERPVIARFVPCGCPNVYILFGSATLSRSGGGLGVSAERTSGADDVNPERLRRSHPVGRGAR